MSKNQQCLFTDLVCQLYLLRLYNQTLQIAKPKSYFKNYGFFFLKIFIEKQFYTIYFVHAFPTLLFFLSLKTNKTQEIDIHSDKNSNLNKLAKDETWDVLWKDPVGDGDNSN